MNLLFKKKNIDMYVNFFKFIKMIKYNLNLKNNDVF